MYNHKKSNKTKQIENIFVHEYKRNSIKITNTRTIDCQLAQNTGARALTRGVKLSSFHHYYCLIYT